MNKFILFLIVILFSSLLYKYNQAFKTWLVRFWYFIANINRWVINLFFYGKEAQFTTILFGLICIVIGGIIRYNVNGPDESVSPTIDILFNSFLGIGCSFLATGILLKFLSNKNSKSKNVDESGLIFIGDRTNFDSFYDDNNNPNGWDKWIEETPYGGEIVIVGQKNSFWYNESSYFKILKALSGKIKVKIIFIGSICEAEDNLKKCKNVFVKMKKTHPHLYKNVTFQTFYTINKSYDNLGFYWNGRRFIVKLYVPFIKNEDAPLLVFNIPGANPRFNLDDCMNNLILDNNKPIRSFLSGFNHIIDHSVIPFDDRMLFKNTFGFAVPTMGMFIKGHCLVFTNKDEVNCANLEKTNRDNLCLLVKKVSDVIKIVYQNDVLVFEHGSYKKDTSVSCGVNQGHIHLVPFTGEFDEIKNIINNDNLFEENNKIYSNLDTALDYANSARNETPYLLFGINNSYYVYHYTNDRVSQYMRKVLANYFGESEYDWKKINNEEYIKEVCDELRDKF